MVSFEKIAKKVDSFNAEKNKANNNSNFYFFFRVSGDILLGVIAGITLGFLLDSIFKTKLIFIIICVFLGFTGAIVNIYKKINNGR